tara:strand:+ start:533 stop:775 length:243 start_codon:yes stop_codon:yes gene_type:complete
MKSKNIPEDIKRKSIEEVQNEIQEIIKKIENNEINLSDSAEKYNRLIQLNNHIHDQFKKKANEIKHSVPVKKKTTRKDLK